MNLTRRPRCALLSHHLAQCSHFLLHLGVPVAGLRAGRLSLYSRVQCSQGVFHGTLKSYYEKQCLPQVSSANVAYPASLLEKHNAYSYFKVLKYPATKIEKEVIK